MSFIRKIKDNRFIRGLHFLFSNYFGWKRSGFGHIGRNVIITPPYRAVKEILISTTMWV